MSVKIGERLVLVSAMSKAQVEEVLRRQRAGDDRLFGEIALALGYIHDEALRKYVEAKETWKGLNDMSEQESDCEYRNTCHFYNSKQMIFAERRLKGIYCIESPEKCAIYQQARVIGKPLSITLWPTGKLSG